MIADCVCGVWAADERSDMYANKIVNVIGQSLLAAQESASPQRPFFTVAVVVEAIYAMPRRPSREENGIFLHEKACHTTDPCRAGMLSSSACHMRMHRYALRVHLGFARMDLLHIMKLLMLPFHDCRIDGQIASCVQILSDNGVATLLVMVHMHLQKAGCPRHQLQSLGPLKALLELLDMRACVAPTFRHIMHILLQCLRTR